MTPKVRGIILGITLVACFGFVTRPKQEPAKPKAVVDQHWRVVAATGSADLERQLKLLNAAGVTVDPTQIRLVGESFVVITCDETNPYEEEAP